MKLNFRCLLLSGMLALGSTTLASQAMAQTTADVDFNGVVQGACTFGAVSNGVINANGAGDRLVTTTPGRVSITCTQAAQVALSAPAQQSGPTLSPVAGGGAVTSLARSTSGANAGATGTDSASMSLPAVGTDQLDVSMAFQNSTALPAGTYSFRVTLTATP